MISSENREPNKEIDELERIRMLENRMRKPGKNVNNEQSLRSIKSTDSKRIYSHKEKIIIFQEASEGSKDPQKAEELRLEEDVKNNKKITDYFGIKSSAKKQQNSYPLKQEIKVQKQIVSDTRKQATQNKANLTPNPNEEVLKEQNRMLKEKLRLKDQNMLNLKNKVKTGWLDAVIKLHKMNRNEMRLRVNHNKIRLGEYLVQKKGSDFWVDGTEIREVREKIENIVREKDELQKSKKLQMKKSNKEYVEDPEEWKNSLAAQMHFLSREETHLHEVLKRLQEQKALHIKEYKLLYDQEHSKYGKVDPATGVANWPKIGQYQLLGLLGKGGFSQVYKAFDTEELREVACKLHELSPQWNSHVKQNFIKHAMRQEEVHKMLNHSNIVKLFGTVEIDQNAFCTILEYCEGPDLSYYLKKHKRLPEKEAKMVIKQVINAIKYLHELPEKVIHYDLKPQNIMFHKGKIKITDFGLCKITNEGIIELTSQGVGTYWYLPPECFVTEEKAVITPKVDIWSIGVIYFEMLYGQKPFGNQMSQMRILNEGIMLKANLVNFPNTPKCSVSNESKDFIKACLKANVDQRLDIRGASSHSLFEKR